MREAKSLQDGAHTLLADTVKILNENNMNYIIVGGWSPYLLNDTVIKHPGTKDIDILFSHAYQKGNLKDIIISLLKNNFILSAKHDFQLFRKIKVKDNEFVYNIDLLHPYETRWQSETYVDHLELDIPADRYQSKNFKMKSIALPNASCLFDGLYTNKEIDFPLSDGTKPKQTFRLMDEVGCLITKSKSVSIKKRERDSLDIFLAINQNQNYSTFITKILSLKKQDVTAYNCLYGIREAYDKQILFPNIRKYCDLKIEEYDKTFQKFFDDSDLYKPAEN